MKKWIVLVGILLVGIGAGYRWLIAERGAAAVEAGRWKAAEAGLRGRLTALEKERDALRNGQPAPLAEIAPAGAPTHAPKKAVDESASRAALLQLLEEKDRQLTGAANSIRDLQARLEEMGGRLEQIQEQQAKLQASEAALRERLDAAAQQGALLAAAVKVRDTRVAEVEAANQELRKKTDDSGRRLARLQQFAGDLEDLARRREAYLTNILGRYREATDLFRAMSVRLEHPREGAGPPLAATDVSRLQNTITLADEDMRQLRSLNTRAAALQKDLAELSRR